MSDVSAPTGSGHLTGFGTKGYRTYVLLTLTFVYTLNFVDRILKGNALGWCYQFQQHIADSGARTNPPKPADHPKIRMLSQMVNDELTVITGAVSGV